MFPHFIRACFLILLASPSLAMAGPFKGMIFGLGGAAGVDFHDGRAIGSPMISIGLEAGGEYVRFYFDADSAPTFLHAFNDWDIAQPVFMITMGPSFGTQDIRVGPIVTFGAVDVGGGIRAQATPWKDKAGGSHGFEMRVSYLPAATAQVALLYTWRPTWGVRDGSKKKKKKKGAHATIPEIENAPEEMKSTQADAKVPVEMEEAQAAEEDSSKTEEVETNAEVPVETESVWTDADSNEGTEPVEEESSPAPVNASE